MMGILKKIMLDISKTYVDSVVDQTSKNVNEKIDKLTKKIVYILKCILPSIIYSILFFGIGILILIMGIGDFIDSITATKGMGAMLAGLLLVFLGMYYKSKFENTLKELKVD